MTILHKKKLSKNKNIKKMHRHIVQFKTIFRLYAHSVEKTGKIVEMNRDFEYLHVALWR